MSIIPAPSTRRPLFEDVHDDYRESFRSFLKAEVVPHHEQWQERHIVSRDLFTKAAEYGFLAMAVDEEYGGSGVADWRFNAVLAEEAAYAIVQSSWMGPSVHNDLGMPYLLAGSNEEQRQRWFPGVASGESILALAMTEPGTGSDLAGIATRAKRDGDGWIVNGGKTFISNGINADLVVTAVRTSDDPHRGLSMFVIERGMEGFERGRQIHKRGQHANDTAELFFNDCQVPAENMLGEEGTGFAQLMAHLIPERLGLAVSSMAAAEAALDLTLDYVKERRAFGRPIGSFQNTRFMLAELQTRVELSRCWMDRTIGRFVEGTATVQEAAMAKYWTTDLLCEVADAGVQLFGGYGYTTEYKISEIWADARVNRIYAGTNEIMKELVGRSMGL
ncbi:acyl-CoA dehydrogenase family protein [Conexibacter sp. JD483]|uniref:acyl-CoA dehydrogenase family protein n=1 Tax=unclassified Conexibacter TaxID=2627773 RepID=UPI002724A23C|nr:MULTISPECIES: acyl-CoA dehydrogenase family protein [unclassified Conexibacter]MDO8189413.1 acyl-CoA dehydrogenase family protein [Conexibacter sp. CPCC 205706]MDO8202022.1 acyl-CoA dehydrogenase family protein [Conexibacter sp. CPCC 205762]MDR9372485.1 acyl-CoA dehydrogenase family protein [Conexibacter sp. JD483]